MKTEEDYVIASLGHKSATPKVVKGMAEYVNILRVNATHMDSTGDFDDLINLATTHAPGVSVACDTRGREVRTEPQPVEVPVVVGKNIEVGPAQGEQNGTPYITLLHSRFLESLNPGNELVLLDGKFRMQYEGPGKHGLRCLVTESSGKFPAGKKVSVMSPDVEIDGPLLTEKDEQFVEHIQRVINRDRIVVEWFFLSHTLRGKDCRQFRSLIKAEQKICAKPESLYAMAKIPEIAQAVDMVMVPAGDLRQAVGRDLPYWEKQIIEQSRAANKEARITVATGRATSMLNGGKLSQGEEIGLWRAWELGADGVMDSDSFTLGSNPVAVAKELRAVITAYRLRYPR